MDVEKVRGYYNQQAKEWSLDCRSTINDPNERRLEINSILRYIKKDDQILEIGCGNGYTAIEITKRYDVRYWGVDFSEQMVEIANKQREYSRERLKKNIEFEVANILELPFKNNIFDKVVSERCLINLSSWDDQKRAILEINRVLKPQGIFLMLESFFESKAVTNSLRRKFNLPDIPIKWFNLYFDDSKLIEFVQPYFKLTKIDYFNSSYYLFTRVLYPALLKVFNREPNYESKSNHILSFLPNLGKFGYIRLYVLRKIEQEKGENK